LCLKVTVNYDFTKARVWKIVFLDLCSFSSPKYFSALSWITVMYKKNALLHGPVILVPRFQYEAWLLEALSFSSAPRLTIKTF
jgi:hypothetical protein